MDTQKIPKEIGDVKFVEEVKADDDDDDLVARIRQEATVLVERVLEESVEIIGQRPNGHESMKQEYNSESENYAITCDDIDGVDVIKSPTIESMSGKSFDDNMSFTDEHTHLPLHVQNTPTATTTTTTVTTQFQQQQQQQQQQPAATATKESGGDIPISSETTPVPTAEDTPTPKPRGVKEVSDLPSDLSNDIAAPVPKPRNPIKHTEQVENLAALGEHSDSVSLRSFDFTEELSKTDEPSTDLSNRSQLRDIVTVTTITTASEDQTESFEPTSEISVDESEAGEKTTSFYIGESSRNVITKTSTKGTPQDEEPPIEAKDISLMKEVSVDSDETNDVFKEYVTMKRDEEDKMVRQGSETRNDLLEEPKMTKVTTEESLTTSTGSSGRAVIEIAPSSSEDPDESSKDTDKFELPLEKSEWETSEKEIPVSGKPKVVHSPQQATGETTLIKDIARETEESLELAKTEVKSMMVKETLIEESTTEFEDISSFIGIPEMQGSIIDNTLPPEGLFDTTIRETLNKQAASQHYSQREEPESLGFESTGDLSSMEEHLAKEEQKSLGFVSTETAEDFSSMEDYYTEKLDKVVERLKTEESLEKTNRWSLPEMDNSSSSESYQKTRPLSEEAGTGTGTGTGTSSDYQTARDFTSTCREATEYISAVSTLGSSSGKTISSHESMRSLDSQSETSANLGSIDVSELSETLVASSTENDALENEEMLQLRDLGNDDEDSEESPGIVYPLSEMKRSQEMIFKPKLETDTVEKPKEAERSWDLSYPVEDTLQGESDKVEDILLYTDMARRSIDESKLASSLDEGSILSVSMSSTSNIDTVVENFEDLIGSAGSSSLTGIEGFQTVTEDTTFLLEMDSPQDSHVSTPPGHKLSESSADKEAASALLLGEGKESESESDTDPYESEYARQFRSPKERKNKKKKQAAAEMDHSSELEKRPFTPSQLVAEIIVEDIATEELEAEALKIEERRPSQNMQDYSNIPDIMVTEDLKSPILEEEVKTLYKVRTEQELNKASDEVIYQKAKAEEKEQDFQRRVQEQYKQKLEELKRAEVGNEFEAPDSPDSFEMVEQPDISDEFVIIEEVAKEANEVDLGGKTIKIKPLKYEQKHDEEVEKIIIKSAPADPKLGSQLFKDDLNFEFEESPPTAASSGSEPQEESDSSDTAAANKRWVEMQLTDNQLRYPYDLQGAVLEDIKEEDDEFQVGSSRISSFKDSFSSTPEYDAANRRYHSRGEHDDVSMSSLQEFESLEQAISLENRNRTYQGSTDSSNGSFTRRYMVRHSGSGTAPGDDVSVSSLKEFEGLENACIEAHLIEIKAKEEAALLSRSDESNKSNGSDRGVTKVTRTVTHTDQAQTIESLLKQQLEPVQMEAKSKLDSLDSEKDSIDSQSQDHMLTSSIESFDISKDLTTRSDVDSHSRQQSIESFGDEQFDLMSKFVSGGVTLGDGLTTTTTTTTTSTDPEGHEHTVTRVITTTTTSLPSDDPGMSKDISVDSLNLCLEQTTSSAGTTATYQSSAGNSQMSGSVTSCASSTLMEDSIPGSGVMSSSQMSSSFWSHDESTVVEDDKTKQ